MSPWWHHSVENERGKVSEWYKILCAKMMKFGWTIFFTRGLFNSPGISWGLRDPRGLFPRPSWRMSLFFSEIFLTRSAHHFWNMIRKVYFTCVYRVIRLQRQASLERLNFGPRRNFSILFLRFLWSGKFILAVNIFGWLFIYINWVP